MNVSELVRCEAAAMHAAAYLGRQGPGLDVCDEIAVEDRAGYQLCGGCAEALDMLVGFQGRFEVRRG